MPYRSAQLGKLYFVEWSPPVSPEELRRVVHDVEEARRISGLALTYVSTVPAQVNLPRPEEREALNLFARELGALVESVLLVVTGSGLRISILRSVLTGMALINRHGARMRVYSELDAALRQATLTVGKSVETMRGELAARGIAA